MSNEFFCAACLVVRPRSDQSPDPRYCQSCYDFMAGEAPTFVKKPPADVDKTPRHVAPRKQEACNKNKEVELVGDNFDTSGKRGRPKKELPRQLMFDLAADGQTTREIADRVGVSHSTVARTLKGDSHG